MNVDFLDDLDQLENQENDNNLKIEEQPNNDLETKQYSDLLKDQQFLKHLSHIEDIIANKLSQQSLTSEKDETTIIHKSNIYAAQIDRQINCMIKFIKQVYNKKLPQLETIVPNSAQFCKALLQIQQTPKKQNIQFKYLSPHQSISLKIAISSPHEQIPQNQYEQLMTSAKTVTLLHEHHNLLMIYLESCMQIVAPNLCKLIGSATASKLISLAGGIDKLAMMPACNIQVMGGTRSAQIGQARLQRNHTGIFGQMDIVKNSPSQFQMQLVRMLATNTAKCARADYLKTSNIHGDKLKDQMLERFEKIQQQGGLMRIQRPLPIPDEQPKKKRGGKKYRKMKQLYQMSEIRKNQNKMKFGEEAEQEINQGVGFGMLKSGIGKLKVNIKKQKLLPSKKLQQRINKRSGLQSTLDLASTQGIQLINPSKNKQKTTGVDSYFNRQSGFRTVLNQKFNK